MSDKREKEKKEGHKGIMKGKESKQTKLKLEEVDREKRVKFRQEGQEEKLRQEMEEFKVEVRKELLDFIAESRKEIEKLKKALEERIIKIEKYIEYQKEEERRKKEREDRQSEGEVSVEDSESRSNVSVDKSDRSYKSYWSYGNRSGKSDNTLDSVGLSDRELDKVRKMVLDKEKEERRDNIVIKGMVTEEKDLKKWVSEFIKDKMNIDIEIINCRKSGKVIVAKLKDRQMKRKVMENKSKLKGGRIFIENDLTWQERKIQEKINMWAKEEREKGKEVKIGYARVRTGGVWRKWEEVERELERNRRKGKDEVRNEERVEDRFCVSQEGDKGVCSRDEEKENRRKVLFWNLAGINKDKECWKFIGGFDFVSLCETWVEEKDWTRIKNRLPKTHEWNCCSARKDKKKGRAKGGMIIGRRLGWGEKGSIIGKEIEEGIVVSRIRNDKKEKDFIMISVYNVGNWEKIEKVIRKIVTEEEKDKNIIIGGDFNIRIGEYRGQGRERGEEDRCSKDKIISSLGRKMINLIEELGSYILNGTHSGDEAGEFTYVGTRGSSIIDYVIVNEPCIGLIGNFKIGERVDSDHMPLIIELKEEGEEESTEKKDGEVRRKMVTRWDEEARLMYKENSERLEWEESRREEQSIEDTWQRLKKIINDSTIKKERKTVKKEIGYKCWWDKDCTRMKRKVHRSLRKWKIGKARREKYIEDKKKLRELMEEKRKKKKKEEEEELKSLKNETEVWNFINKRRGKKTWIDNNIGKEEWKRYFMELLDGSEEKEAGNSAEDRGLLRIEMENVDKDEEERELEDEEIYGAIKRLKLKKAAGIDELPMEVWKFGGSSVINGIREIVKKVWKSKKMPEDWKISVVVPLYKKGDHEKTENYRGISLLCTAYKIYAEVLRNRLEIEIERRKLLPESQGGFRKGRGTIDNIFILNHIIQREESNKENKEKKVYAMFVDFEAAFDNVNRRKMWEILEEKKIGKGLIERLEKIYEATVMTVRNKEGLSSNFEVKKGVRQGCVMSPLLFNLYIADVDLYMKRKGIGGVSLGSNRIWSLAYADDMVLLAKNREALLEMMAIFKRFCKDRDLKLNTEKTKILVFNRKKKEKLEKWKWGEKVIEEVQNFKYLGFTFNRNGGYNEHIKELARKGRLAANMVWGVGERSCKKDFNRRWMLFRYLVESVMAYGVEIWGWAEKKELEKVMLDYVRWLFKLDFCTPRYIVTRELGIDKLKIKWGLRARRYEGKIKGMEENRWVKICWEEKKRNNWIDQYSKERERYYNRNGWGILAVEDMIEEEGNLERIIIEKERDVQRQIEDGRIRKSKYNKDYKKIVAKERVPKYLKKESVDNWDINKEIIVLARMRCGNMEEENKYWLEEKYRKCVFCDKGRDNLNHFVRECEKTKGWFDKLGNSEESRVQRIKNEIFDEVKRDILWKFWKEKEKKIKARKELEEMM